MQAEAFKSKFVTEMEIHGTGSKNDLMLMKWYGRRRIHLSDINSHSAFNWSGC